jgi:hypothetical protein
MVAESKGEGLQSVITTKANKKYMNQYLNCKPGSAHGSQPSYWGTHLVVTHGCCYDSGSKTSGDADGYPSDHAADQDVPKHLGLAVLWCEIEDNNERRYDEDADKG